MTNINTGIEWTDATWSPVTGCSKVSPGCAHCYAEGVALRFWPSQYPPVEYETYSVDACCPITEARVREFTDVQCHEDRLDVPLRWRKPRRVFVNSMSDLFHEDVPDEFIDRVFAVMNLASDHTFQVLTKRPERMRAYLMALGVQRRISAAGQEAFHRFRHEQGWPLPNVWLGVSVENQHFADERIPLLLQTPAAVRFVSLEPLLGPIDCCFDTEIGPLSWLTRHNIMDDQLTERVDWVIAGGESGPKARPCDLSWIRSIVEQCKAAGVPAFVKQLGAAPLSLEDRILPRDKLSSPADYPDGFYRCLNDRKGGDPSEWPEDLRVREWPRVTQ